MRRKEGPRDLLDFNVYAGGESCNEDRSGRVSRVGQTEASTRRTVPGIVL